MKISNSVPCNRKVLEILTQPPHDFRINEHNGSGLSDYYDCSSELQTDAPKIMLCTVQKGNMKSSSYLLFLSLVALSMSIKYPDVSKNDEYCYKSFMQDTAHNCYCEPFKEGFLEGKHSYIWQYVSIIYKT